MRRLLLLALLPITALADAPPINDAAKSAKGLDSALNALRAPTRNTAPLAPAEALKQFKPKPGYAVDLIAAEPIVRQPLNIQFDARGRMWVVNYAQYPFPAGLKVVEYDRYIRAKFDKTPLPPPAGDKGADFITIHEDTDNDGTFDKVKTVVDGLNIATSVLPDHDGFWVTNPPYLLYYPDANHDDAPDGPPVVHLSGFGLEDTHAVANSLAHGPDGWIYGAQGSTCTAKVKVHLAPKDEKGGLATNSQLATTTDFLGQLIWRYHPTRHTFEIFAEGGGNTFGVEFDDAGRLFSGTNWSNHRGLHFVQGGYYLKGWGKHGPLTNPFAFGFFDHMPHAGNAQRLTHTFSVYGGGLMPELAGKIVSPNSLQSRIQITTLDRVRSSFKTTEEDPIVTTPDGWFRPVDLKVGPDGAIYVADLYENRISHVDPRDTWDRSNGRIYRIRPDKWDPKAPAPPAAHGFTTGTDPTRISTNDLVTSLSSPSRLARTFARRELVRRNDPDAAHFPLLQILADKVPALPVTRLEALWTIHGLGKLDEPATMLALQSKDPAVVAWAIRLIADAPTPPADAVLEGLARIARKHTSPDVRSQLASSLKRLPATPRTLAVLREMLLHTGDETDPHLPLLLWWAVEAKLRENPSAVLDLFAQPDLWPAPIVRSTITQRLARRFAATSVEAAAPVPATPGSMPAVDAATARASQEALLRLLRHAPSPADRALLFAGIAEGFEGRAIRPNLLLPDLAKAIAQSGNPDLAARAGDESALARLLESLATEAKDAKSRDAQAKQIELLSQIAPDRAAPALLKIATTAKALNLRRAALSGLTRSADPSIPSTLLSAYASFAKDPLIRPAAISTLLARKPWALDLLKAIDANTIPKSDLTPDHLDRLRAYATDKAVAAALQKTLGQLARPTSEQKEQEIARIRTTLTAAGATPGDAKAGQALFAARCANCHKLFGQGATLGPDLTPYERRNLDFWLISVVDPSAAIREEYTNFRIDTKDDQILTGLIAARGPDSVTLTDATQQKTTIARADIASEQALNLSIMPEGLLSDLSPQQLRDLFAYLQSEKAPPK
ncbi:MAG TPA: c-type cytochrome [Tepidisphaeraceae bacterium]|nr:c-type cytochrome [Tepidisphaeraceae bacterium]